VLLDDFERIGVVTATLKDLCSVSALCKEMLPSAAPSGLVFRGPTPSVPLIKRRPPGAFFVPKNHGGTMTIVTKALRRTRQCLATAHPNPFFPNRQPRITPMKLHLHRFSFAGFPRAAVWWAAAAVLLGAFAPPLRAQSPGNFSTLTANSNVTLSGNFVDIYANDLQFGNYAAGNTSNPGYGSFYNDNGAGNIANVTLVGGRSAVAWLWQEGGNSTVAQMLLDENGNLTVYSGSNNITLNPSVPSITLGNSGNSETLAPLIGTVAANNLPRWSGSGLENGTITDNGTAVGVNTTALSSTFTVNGTTSLKGNVTLSGNGTSLVFADGSVQATSATANVTSGYIPRMTSTGYANGIMQDNGSGIGIGAPPQSGFAIFMEDSNSANLTTNLTEISAQAANFPTVPTNAQMTGLDGQAVWGGNQSSSSGYAVAGYFQSTGTTVSPGLLGVSIGVQSLAENDNSGTINWAYGGDFAVNNVYTGSIGYAYGAWLSVANQHTGNIAHAYGLGLQNMSQFGGSINNDYGVYIYPPYVDSNSTIGNNYGLYIANQTVATVAELLRGQPRPGQHQCGQRFDRDRRQYPPHHQRHRDCAFRQRHRYQVRGRFAAHLGQHRLDLERAGRQPHECIVNQQ
jgi:hypothetical protein